MLVCTGACVHIHAQNSLNRWDFALYKYFLCYLHKTFYTTYQIKHTKVSEKGNFIHKVPENKLLNITIGGPALSVYNAMLLLLH